MFTNSALHHLKLQYLWSKVMRTTGPSLVPGPIHPLQLEIWAPRGIQGFDLDPFQGNSRLSTPQASSSNISA